MRSSSLIAFVANLCIALPTLASETLTQAVHRIAATLPWLAIDAAAHNAFATPRIARRPGVPARDLAPAEELAVAEANAWQSLDGFRDIHGVLRPVDSAGDPPLNTISVNEQLTRLLLDPDPKATAVAMIVSLDGPDLEMLPAIANLIDDKTPCNFPALPPFTQRYNSIVTFGSSDQTIGHIAAFIIRIYLERSEELDVASHEPESTWEFKTVVEHFLERRRDSGISTAQFRIRLDRALGGTRVVRPDRVKRVNVILDDIRTLPMPRRFFALRYLETRLVNPADIRTSDFETLAAQVPHDVRLGAVIDYEHRTDPDVPPVMGANYFLGHLNQLFDTADADAMIVAEQAFEKRNIDATHPNGMPSIQLIYAIAQLRPDDAENVISRAQRLLVGPENLSQRCALALDLLHVRGQPGLDEAVNWYYAQIAIASPGNAEPEAFFEESNRVVPDLVPELARRVVIHPQFGSMGPRATLSLVKAINAHSPSQVIPAAEVTQGQNDSNYLTNEDGANLARWKAALVQSFQNK